MTKRKQGRGNEARNENGEDFGQPNGVVKTQLLVLRGGKGSALREKKKKRQPEEGNDNNDARFGGKATGTRGGQSSHTKMVPLYPSRQPSTMFSAMLRSHYGSSTWLGAFALSQQVS